MVLRYLSHSSKELSLGQVLRLLVETELEVLESPSNEFLYVRDLKTGEYWSIESDRIMIHLYKELIDLVHVGIKGDQLAEMSTQVYPDLREGKRNKKARQQPVVFVCRKRGDLSQRVPSLDDRDFWRKLEQAFPNP